MEDPVRKRRFAVGYALAPKKIQSFIQDSLVNLAEERGVDLVQIDTDKPLTDQGPFDCLLHKLTGDDWIQRLKDYSAKNPNVLIIDSPESIERLHNRISMLEVVTELKIQTEGVSFGIPKQVVIHDSDTLLNPNAWGNGLTFPVIAKPLVADGSATSHKMSLVFNREGLSKLEPPIVLQEFVNHGGVIFKVYVVDGYVKCVKRKSLPDVSEEKMESLGNFLSFSQISNLAATHERDEDKYIETVNLEDAEMPPLSFINDIAGGLRQAMKLHLFNFDVIRDSRFGNRYLVIDINYFPGYAKMPSYETVLTDFFWDVLTKKEKNSIQLLDDPQCKRHVLEILCLFSLYINFTQSQLRFKNTSGAHGTSSSSNINLLFHRRPLQSDHEFRFYLAFSLRTTAATATTSTALRRSRCFDDKKGCAGAAPEEEEEQHGCGGGENETHYRGKEPSQTHEPLPRGLALPPAPILPPKVEEGCHLTSAEDIAGAIHNMFRIFELQTQTCFNF